MPYLAIDPNEQTTAQGGVKAPQASSGGGGGSVGGAAPTNASGGSSVAPGGTSTPATPQAPAYTNLSSYLQANAGNNANTQAVNQTIGQANNAAQGAAQAYQATGQREAETNGKTDWATNKQAQAEAAHQTAANLANGTKQFQVDQTFGRGNSYGGLDAALTGHTQAADNSLARATKAVNQAVTAYKQPPAPPQAAAPAAPAAPINPQIGSWANPNLTLKAPPASFNTGSTMNLGGFASGGEIPTFDKLDKYLRSCN